MHKCVLFFIISYLKKSIFNLECANKLSNNSIVIDEKIINELKKTLKEVEGKINEK